MVTIREAIARLVSFCRKDQRDREFEQELESHLEMATGDHMRDGLAEAEARRRALARLGGIEPAKQLHRETRGLPWIDGTLQDLRYSVRTLRRSPTFALAAIATLAIGIGATTAIFSVVNATLLRPLPYPDAHQLIDVHTKFVDGRVTTGLVSNAEIVRLRSLPLVAAVGGVMDPPFDATMKDDDGRSTAVVVRLVTDGFFDTLGLPLARGRVFTAEEHLDGPNFRPSALVISHRAWLLKFGGDPDIIGRTIRLAEFQASLTVVGIAAPELDFPSGTDFWANARISELQAFHNYLTVVRLRPDATSDQLLSAGNLALVDLGTVVSNAEGRQFVLQSFVASLVGDLRPILLIVLGATALLLILACVNVSNLLLARGATQSHEIAMRAALGAGRGRVIRGLVTQSMVLASAGTLAGAAFSVVAVRLLLTLGRVDLPHLETVPFDWRVLTFSIVVLLVSGVGMGLVPALRLSDTDLKTVLNEHGRRTASSGTAARMMSGMVVAEVALAIALVAGAGWLIQSFARLRATDPGFATSGRLVIDVRPTRPFSSQKEVLAWSEGMLAHVRDTVPEGLVGAATTFPLQLDRDGTTDIELADEVPVPGRVRTGRTRLVTTSFFEAMATPVVAGRSFTVDDRATTQLVAVVNRAFASRFFPAGDPVGAAFAFGQPPDRNRMHVIIGVVDDVRYKALSLAGEATVYLAQAQGYAAMRQSVVIAPASGSAEALVPSVRAALERFDPGIVATFATSDAIVADTLGRQALGMTLMFVFGATALALAAIGLYGVIAYAATERRSELATRLALGATGGQIFWLMMSKGQRLMGVGVVLGLGLAHAGGRVVAGNVFAMRAGDPAVLLTAGVLVTAVAWLATMIPAVRASRQDPVSVLRD